MRLYAAPMEGLTNITWRQVHARLFSGVDAYFTPFLSPNQNLEFSNKELREIDPAANDGISVIPQLLTNNAAHFLWAVGELRHMGYTRVDLNLGCPSGTVMAKRKGAGFLTDPVALNGFLGEIFANADIKISIKTRLGRCDMAEWESLLAIYVRYPLVELTVHPRLAVDGYNGHPRMEGYAAAVDAMPFPVCYNGDLSTVDDASRVIAAYPSTDALMLGRGLTGDPALVRQLKGGAPLNEAELRGYIEELYAAYRTYYPDQRAAIGRMKEHWLHLKKHFADSDRFYRRICKADSAPEYEAAAAVLWRDCAFMPLENGWEAAE